jgi:CHC2 zinc finger
MNITQRAAESLATTPYPFSASERDYRRMLERIPTRDLLAEIEAARWLALDLANVPGDSRAVAEIQLEALVDESRRRRRLWEARIGDPLRPAWPTPDRTLRARIAAVKAAWPIVPFCADVLGAILRPTGRDRYVARCPLPGHDDRHPSFTVYVREGRAWCHGCHRGGDIIALTGFAFGHEGFYEKLEQIELYSGIVDERAQHG